MPVMPPQPVQLNCPTCSTPLRAALFTLVDVGQQPELKGALLSGQLNVAVCPNCGMATMISAPLIYHDPAKQLFLVYLPQELKISPQEQERYVGEITSFVLRDLPAQTPRGYLLQPRRFISFNSLLDSILEADGISREMLDAQRKRVDLIGELAGALDDEANFSQLVAARRADITPEFFAVLNTYIQATPPNQEEARQVLLLLRAQLAEAGFEVGDAGEEFEADSDLQAVIERLHEVADEELSQAVAELRPLIDYSFFEAWTAQIDALRQSGESDTAARMEARRSQMLELVEEMDRQAQEMFEAGTQLLNTVMNAVDPQAELQAHAAEVDEAFLLVISANAAAAQRAGRMDVAQRLEELGQASVAIIEGRLTPEQRFINELLQAEKPQDATRMLRTNFKLITPDFVKLLNDLADQEEKRANKPSSERLRQLAREAGAMLF